MNEKKIGRDKIMCVLLEREPYEIEHSKCEWKEGAATASTAMCRRNGKVQKDGRETGVPKPAAHARQGSSLTSQMQMLSKDMDHTHHFLLAREYSERSAFTLSVW